MHPMHACSATICNFNIYICTLRNRSSTSPPVESSLMIWWTESSVTYYNYVCRIVLERCVWCGTIWVTNKIIAWNMKRIYIKTMYIIIVIETILRWLAFWISWVEIRKVKVVTSCQLIQAICDVLATYSGVGVHEEQISELVHWYYGGALISAPQKCAFASQETELCWLLLELHHMRKLISSLQPHMFLELRDSQPRYLL